MVLGVERGWCGAVFLYELVSAKGFIDCRLA
jgi:hypothetical protein